MTEIILTATEQIIARHLAERRHHNNRARGVVDRQIGPQSSEATDLNGIGAEMAFARIFNVYPDLGDRPGKEDGITKKGGTYDVKTTKYQNGRLLAVMNKKVEDCEFYVLMIGEFPKYTLTGYASAEELLSGDYIDDLGRGPGHCMKQNDKAFKRFESKTGGLAKPVKD
tara:strand:- start:5 stop:511 length:507 start_codon:yes stop_codon:yes gene_type:complete